MDTGVGGCVKGRVCKDRDILDGEEFQNVEKLGHTYERKRTEKVGQFVLPYSRDGLILNLDLASTERLPLLDQ